jgi:hypothetical protein
MAAHAAPLESQRAHRNAYVFTGPVHSPGSAVSDPPSTAAPAMDGGVERTGGLFPGGLRPLAVEIVTRATTTRRREMWRRRRGISRCIGGLYGFFTPSFSSAACGTRLHVEEFGTTTFGFFGDTGTECRILASRLHRIRHARYASPCPCVAQRGCLHARVP